MSFTEMRQTKGSEDNGIEIEYKIWLGHVKFEMLIRRPSWICESRVHSWEWGWIYNFGSHCHIKGIYNHTNK